MAETQQIDYAAEFRQLVDEFGTELARARCDTIRLKLLKIGAVVRVTVRRVWVSLSGSYPYQELFRQVLDNLRQWKMRPRPAPA